MPRVKLSEFMRHLAEWGLELVRAPTGAPSDRRVDVWLPLPDEEVLVGALRSHGGSFVFEYAPTFQARGDIPPISAFPEKGESYTSKVLFPFFNVRLPPLERDDIQRLMAERGIASNDYLKLLGELASNSPTSPYILRYEQAPEAENSRSGSKRFAPEPG